MPNDIFKQSLLERLGAGEDTDNVSFDVQGQVNKYEQDINTASQPGNRDVSKMLLKMQEQASIQNSGQSNNKKTSLNPELYSGRTSLSGAPSERVRFWESERSAFEQLGRGLAMGAEGFVDQALLGAPSTFTDFEELAPDPETGLERFFQMAGETAGFILPFMITKGSMGAGVFGKGGITATKAGARTGTKALEDSVINNVSKKALKFDKTLYKDSDAAMDFLAKQATKITVGNKLAGFTRMSSKEKTLFSKDMQERTGTLIKEFAAKNGIRGIDDKIVGVINKDMGNWWTSIDGRVLNNLEDAISSKLLTYKMFANKDQTGKFAAFLGAMGEEAALFAMVESMALGVQDLSSADMWGLKPEILDGDNKVPIGFKDYLDTVSHASTFGAALGWTRVMLPGGIRGGLFKHIEGSPLKNINSMLNKEGTNFAKNIKTTTKEGRNALNNMHRAYAQIKPNILSGTNNGTRNIATELERQAAKHKDMKLLPKRYTDSMLSGPNDLAALAKDKTLTMAQLNAVARIQQDGLVHLAKKVRTDLRTGFLKTMKADWFGGTVEGVRIKGSMPRVLAGGTLFGASSWFDESIPMDDKVFHTMLGMAFLKGGRELQFKGKDVSLDQMKHTWNTKESGLGGLKYSDFPANLKILGEINNTTGVDIGQRGVWGPIFKRIDSEIINSWDQVQPEGGVREGRDVYYDTLLKKDSKGKYKYIMKDVLNEDGISTIIKGEQDLNLKGDQAQFVSNYITWARNTQSARNTEGKKLLPEGYRPKSIELGELTAKEAQSFEKMLSSKGIYNAYDSFKFLYAGGGKTIKTNIDKAIEDAISLDFTNAEGKSYKLTIEDADGTIRMSPIDYRNLDLKKMDGEHQKYEHHILKNLETWNRMVQLRHKNSDMPFSKSAQAIKIDNTATGLIQWSNHMEGVIERFSKDMKPEGFEKIIDFTDGFLEAQYDIWNDFNSIDKSISTLEKLYERKSKLDIDEVKTLELVNKLIKENNEVTDKILLSDHKNPRINEIQNIFINNIRDAARNIRGNKSLRPNVTERPTFIETQDIISGKNNKKLSNKEIEQVMKYFHEQGVTIYSNGRKSAEQLSDFGKSIVTFQGHESLKKSKFPVRNKKGEIVGEELFGPKHFRMIQILKDSGIADSFLGVTKDIQLFREGAETSKKEKQEFKNMFADIEKTSLAEYKERLKKAGVSKVEIDNKLLIYESFKDMGEGKEVDKRLKEINETIEELTYRFVEYKVDGKDVKGYLGVLNPFSRQNKILIPATQAQVLYGNMVSAIKQKTWEAEQVFHKQLFDYGEMGEKQIPIMKLITKDLMTERDGSKKIFDAAVLSKLYDVTTNRFIYSKDKFEDTVGTVEMVEAVKNELKLFQDIMSNGWDYSKRQVKERYETAEALEANKDADLSSKLYTLDDLLDYNLGEWDPMDSRINKRKHMVDIFYNTYKGNYGKFSEGLKEKLVLHNEILRRDPNTADSIIIKVMADLQNSKSRERLSINLKSKVKSTREEISVSETPLDAIREKHINIGSMREHKIIEISGQFTNTEGKSNSMTAKDSYIEVSDLMYEGKLPYMPKKPKDLIEEYRGKANSELRPEIRGEGNYAPKIITYIGHPNSLKGNIQGFKMDARLVDNLVQNYLTTLIKDKQLDKANSFIIENNIKLEQRVSKKTGESVEIKDSWTFGGKNGADIFTEGNSFPLAPEKGRQLFRDMLFTLELRDIKKEKGLDNFYKDLAQDPVHHAQEQTRMKILASGTGVKLSKQFLREQGEFIEKSSSVFKGKKDIIDMNKRATGNHPEGRTIKQVIIRDEGVGGVVKELFDTKQRLLKMIDSKLQENINKGSNKKVWTEVRKEIENTENISFTDSYAVDSKKFLDYQDYIRYGKEPTESKSGGIKAHYSDIKNPKLFGLYKTFWQKNKYIEHYMKNTDVERVIFNTGSKKMGRNYHKEMAEKMLEIDDFKDLKKISDSKYQMPMDIEGMNYLYRKANKKNIPVPANQSLHFTNPEAINSLVRDVYGIKIETAVAEAKRLGDTAFMGESITKFKQIVNRKGDRDLMGVEGFTLGDGQMEVAKILTELGAPHQLGGITMTELMLKDTFHNIIDPKEPGSHAVFGADIRLDKEGKLMAPLKIPVMDRTTNEFHQLGEIIVPFDFRTREVTSDMITIEIPQAGKNNIIVHGSEASKYGIDLRNSGKMYDYFKDGQQIPLYEVKVDMYENRARTSRDKDFEDVWIVKDLSEANEQLQAMKDGPGGAVNFANKIVKGKDTESGLNIHILKDNKERRGDHKYIYVKGSAAHKALEKLKYQKYTEEGLASPEKALVLDSKRKKGETYLKGAQTPYNIVLFARRDPYVKEGSVMPVSLKDFNEKDHGNQLILNDKDAYHHAESDMDGDTAAIGYRHSKLASQEFINIAKQSGPTEVRPTNGNAAYDSLQSGPYNPMKEVSQLEFTELQAKAAKLRGSIMQVSHLAHWFLSNRSSQKDKIYVDGKIVDYQGPLFGISSTNKKGFDTWLGIRQEVLTEGANSKFRQRLKQDIQSLVDTAKGNWDTKYYSSARDITNRLLFDKDFGLFVPMSKEKLPEGTFKDQLVLQERPTIDFRQDHPTAFKAIESLWRIRKESLSHRNNEHHADGSMRQPKFRDRKKTTFRYNDSLKNFEWGDEAQALKKELGFDTDTNMLNRFNVNSNFLNSEGTRDMSLIDRVDYGMYAGIKDGWNWKNTNTKQVDIIDTYIQRFSEKHLSEENSKAAGDTAHFNRIIKAFRNQVKDVSSEFHMLEKLESQLSELKTERFTNQDAGSYRGQKIDSEIIARTEQVKIVRDGLKEFTDVDSYLEGSSKTKLDPKVKDFMDKVFENYQEKHTQIYKEQLGDNFSYSEQLNNINKSASKDMKDNGMNIESIDRRDMLEAIAAERAYTNSAESMPHLLQTDAKTHQELISLLDKIKFEYNEEMSKLMDTQKESVFINDGYIVDTYKEKLIALLNHSKYEKPALKELIFRRLMSPEMELNRIGSYRGNLYFLPKYTNFHKFIKLGLQTVSEYHKGDMVQIKQIMGPFVHAYKQEVYNMQHTFVGDSRLKDGKITPETWSSEHMTMGKRYDKLLLLESQVPEASNIFGKPITQLDRYTLDGLIFNGGLIPDVSNNNRLTNLPYKAITELSGEYGRDTIIDGQKAADTVMSKGNVFAFVVDKDRGSYIRDLQQHKTIKPNRLSEPLTEERSIDMPKSLKEFELNEQKQQKIIDESINCAVTKLVKGN